MQKRIANNKTWIWLAFLLIVLLASRYLFVQDQLEEYPMYASDSPSLTGMKAFYTYLDRHHEVTRWTEAPSELPNSKKQLLLMVEPYFTPNSKELELYERFMENGNTILLLKANPKGMFYVESEFLPEFIEEPVFDRDGSVYHAEVPPIRLRTNEFDEVLLSDDAGVIALKRQFRDGQLIVANSPGWITNENILTEDHLALILGLIDEADAHVILVDEYIHGENAATVMTTYPRWFILFFIQAAILTILWLWYSGKRFGPIFIPREESVRFSDEGIRAMAAWYSRGRRYRDALVIQADYVRASLKERWRIPNHEEWRDLTNHFERKWPEMSKDERTSLLTGISDILKKEKVTKQEFLVWSKRLERIRKEVDERSITRD